MIYLRKTTPFVSDCLANEKEKKRGECRNCEDVFKQLQIDFKNKCYLCEMKEPISINIEHFVPHRGNKNLMFDWNNLFFGCGHCNNTKLAKANYNNLLNCTKIEDGVDTKIKYEVTFPNREIVFLALENNEKVINTVNLLSEIHYGNTINKKLESANLRKKLVREIRNFSFLLEKHYRAEISREDKEYTKSEIIRYLQPEESFTAFKRWIIRENPILFRDFQNYLT